MPRVPDRVLNSVFYLYPTVEDAKAGKHFGGTGFFVFMPATDGGDDEIGWIFAVTNWHVAVRDGASVMRINTVNGPPDIFEFGPEDWDFDPRFDIAILPFEDWLRVGHHKFSVLPTRLFCSELIAANNDVGPGDEVFMVGRFIDHDGGETNKPAVRFGHIGINPTPMAQGPARSRQPCYCIDIHSRTGYSGSPVFVYRTAGNSLDDTDREGPPDSRPRLLTAGTRLFSFLGIHFAQFPELWEIDKSRRTEHEAVVSGGDDPAYVTGMSGMTCVLPAWQIAEVLNMPKHVKGRGGKKLELTFGHHMNVLPDSPKPVEESAVPPATDENPTHREDFMRLASAAARTQKQDE